MADAHTGGTVGHAHRVADAASWPYLPTRRGGAIVAHPYCTECGLIKSVGADRPMELGGIVNLLARLRERLEERGYVFTEAQRRLVVRRIVAASGDDTFGQTRGNQYDLIADAVGYYVGLDAQVVHSYLHHC